MIASFIDTELTFAKNRPNTRHRTVGAALLILTSLLVGPPSMAQNQDTTLAATYFRPYMARLDDAIREDQSAQDATQLQNDQHLLAALRRYVSLNVVFPEDVKIQVPRYVDVGHSYEGDYFALFRFKWIRSLLGPGSSPRIAIAEYLAARSIDKSNEQDEEFHHALHEFMSSDIFLKRWDQALDQLVVDTRRAGHDYDVVVSNAYSSEERANLLRLNDLPGRYLRLKDTFSKLLIELSGPSIEARNAWARLQNFIQDDVDAQLPIAQEKLDQKLNLRQLLLDAFLNAGKELPDSVARAFKQLRALKDNVDLAFQKVEERSLWPYQTPAGALNDPSMGVYLTALANYQNAVVDFCQLPELDTDSAKLIIGLLDLTSALRDRVDVRVGGRRLIAVRTLERVIANYINANFSSDAVGTFDSVAPQQVLLQLDAYQDEILTKSDPGPTLWASVPMDWRGEMIWTQGGWAYWQYFTPQEYQGLSDANRLMKAAGAEFLLPSGLTGGAIRAAQDLITAKASFVQIALAESLWNSYTLEEQWIGYLREIQTANDFSNWNGRPYDQYLLNNPQ